MNAGVAFAAIVAVGFLGRGLRTLRPRDPKPGSKDRALADERREPRRKLADRRIPRSLPFVLVAALFFEVSKLGPYDLSRGWTYQARTSSRPFEESSGRAKVEPIWRAGRRMRVGDRGVLVAQPRSRWNSGDRYRVEPYPAEAPR
jgi:hypothetical protein